MFDKQALNKKLAEWAGFKNLRTRDTLSQPAEIGSPWLWGQAQDGAFIPLDFTQSLDACFKWLVPKLLSASMSWTAGVRFLWIIEFDVDHRYEGFAETPALALCRAIEKLIDENTKT